MLAAHSAAPRPSLWPLGGCPRGRRPGGLGGRSNDPPRTAAYLGRWASTEPAPAAGHDLPASPPASFCCVARTTCACRWFPQGVRTARRLGPPELAPSFSSPFGSCAVTWPLGRGSLIPSRGSPPVWAAPRRRGRRCCGAVRCSGPSSAVQRGITRTEASPGSDGALSGAPSRVRWPQGVAPTPDLSRGPIRCSFGPVGPLS